MWQGEVSLLCVAPKAKSAVETVDMAQIVAGRGVEGDRYFHKIGTFSQQVPGPDGEITLIEAEALEAIRVESGVMLSAPDARRNIVTRGVPLNHLVGRTFRVGEATLRGIRLCEPCKHLAQLVGDAVLPALLHRGGLRAQIVTGGTIRCGDAIEPFEA